jgi:predicted dehydrogenase
MTTPRTAVRYGIIGYGYFAEKAIAPAIMQAARSELVAVQKRSMSAAKEKAAALNIPLAFESPGSLVTSDEIDAVVIASANALHCGETVLAAEAGKHVLVEKPMALSVDEAERMIASCRANGVKLMVGHMVRLSPLVTRIRQLLGEGKFGTVVRAHAEFYFDGNLSQRRWLTDRALAGGGPVFDVGVHCIDTLRYVLDDEVTAVQAVLAPKPDDIHTESVAQLALKFSHGTPASVFCSFIAPTRRSYIEIICEKGILSAEDFTYSHKTTTLEVSLFSDARVRKSTEEIVVPDLYVKEVEMLTQCILMNLSPGLSGENGLRNQQVLEAALA